MFPRRGHGARWSGTATPGRWPGSCSPSLVAWAFQDIGLAEANKAIVFLLAIALVAARFGLGPGIVATVLGVLAFDFFFVPPYLTFAVADSQFVITFAVMLVVALMISTLAARLRRQVRTARARERRLEALYRLSRELSAVSGAHQLASTAQREVSGIFGTEATIYLPDEERQTGTGCLHRKDYVCRWSRTGRGNVGIRSWPAGRQRHRYAARRQRSSRADDHASRHGRNPECRSAGG